MSSRPSRLLIVDDNEMNRDMLARRLARKGYVIGLADSARDLLPRVKEDGIDLVLLDIEMPEVSGLDALQSLRESYSPNDLPIIMVTAKKSKRRHRQSPGVGRKRLSDEADRLPCGTGAHQHSALP